MGEALALTHRAYKGSAVAALAIGALHLGRLSVDDLTFGKLSIKERPQL